MPEEINTILPDGTRVLLTEQEIKSCKTAGEFRDRLVSKVEKARAEHTVKRMEPLRLRTVERCKAQGLSDSQAAEVWNEVLAGIETDRARAAEQEAQARTQRHFRNGIWGR